MNWCGIRLDRAANTKTIGVESCISEKNSNAEVWVIPVDEAALIANAVLQLLKS